MKQKKILITILTFAAIFTASAAFANLNFDTTSITSGVNSIDFGGMGVPITIGGSVVIEGTGTSLETVAESTGTEDPYYLVSVATNAINGSTGNTDSVMSWLGFSEVDDGTVTNVTGFNQGVGIYGGDVTNITGLYLYGYLDGGTAVNNYGIKIDDYSEMAVTGVNQAINYADKFTVDAYGSVVIGQAYENLGAVPYAGSLLVGNGTYTCGDEASTGGCAPFQIEQEFTDSNDYQGWETLFSFEPDADATGSISGSYHTMLLGGDYDFPVSNINQTIYTRFYGTGSANSVIGLKIESYIEGSVGDISDIFITPIVTVAANSYKAINILDISALSVTGAKQAINYANKFIVDSNGDLQTGAIHTAAPAGSDCNEVGETGKMYYDSTNDNLYFCSGASGWRKFTSAAP